MKIAAIIACMALAAPCMAQNADWQKYDHDFGITAICNRMQAQNPNISPELCHAGERAALLWLIQNDPNATLGNMCAKEHPHTGWVTIAQCVAKAQDGMEQAHEDMESSDTWPGY